MLFQRRFHPGLESGEITRAYRLWSRPQVRIGERYASPPLGLLEVDAIDRVRLAEITDEECPRAGFASRADLVSLVERLGLTLSFETGYELSPGGRVVLARLLSRQERDK